MEYVVAASAVLISFALFMVARELHLIGYMIWAHSQEAQKLLDE